MSLSMFPWFRKQSWLVPQNLLIFSMFLALASAYRNPLNLSPLACPSGTASIGNFKNAATKSPLMMARKSKSIILSDQCRENLLKGIEQVADVVKVTLGPRGRNILLEKEYGAPQIVNDGVTIARSIHLKDKRMNAGAKLVQEVATVSDDRAGDGTTSTTILTYEMCKAGIKYVNEGHNPIPLQKGIRNCAKLLIEEVKRLSKAADGYKDLLNIATVATSGNLKMGENIAMAFDKLGKNAAIVLEDHPSLEDLVEFTEGYTFERDLVHPYLVIREEKDGIEWQFPHFVVCEYKIERLESIMKILEHFASTKAPLVIIAEDFSAEVINGLIVNKMQGSLKAVAVKAPSFGERRKDYLRDIAIATNSTLISKEMGIPLEEATLDAIGNAKSVVIKKGRTSIVTNPQYQAEINARIEALQDSIAQTKSKFDREKMVERVAALSGGIARIMIGASTETEQKEKRMRYEDAINAVRAAAETGYVPGGGVTYLELSYGKFADDLMAKIEQDARESVKLIDEETGESVFENEGAEEMESEIELQKAGASIVLNALPSITKQIASNAGINGDRVVNTIIKANKPFGFGWNAKTNRFGNLYNQGVIDPAKVIYSALDHSASVAGVILTTEGMMVEEEEEDKKGDAPPPPDMPM